MRCRPTFVGGKDTLVVRQGGNTRLSEAARQRVVERDDSLGRQGRHLKSSIGERGGKRRENRVSKLVMQRIIQARGREKASVRSGGRRTPGRRIPNQGSRSHQGDSSVRSCGLRSRASWGRGTASGEQAQRRKNSAQHEEEKRRRLCVRSEVLRNERDSRRKRASSI